MATSRDASPIHSSGGDTIDDAAEDVKPSLAELDQAEPSTPDAASNLTPGSKPTKKRKGTPTTSKKGKSRKSAAGHVWISEGPAEGTEDEGSVVSQSRTKKSEETPDPGPPGKTVGTAVGTRRQANGQVGSVYSGSKVKHIKQEDGTPLWRKTIQYEFLRLVIEDTTPVFTKYSDGEKGLNFADVYIDCLKQSSKTSKILKDRLHVERTAAQNMAMICLLVNVGRMNTTLNFFPEMRAQLRTYHSIPSLQAYKSQRDYKSLQDAPRLKSILKGASEDEDHPRAIPLIKKRSMPRTNAVNLIFMIAQFAPKVSEEHFIDKVDFFDLAMRWTISSKTRARAFLWLMWWYLESDFTKESALNNPFGPGEYKEGQDPDDPSTIPLVVPTLEYITEEQGDLENVDTEEEKEFAEKMTGERKRLLAENASEPPLTMADPNNAESKVIKKLKKGSAAFATDDDSVMLSDVDSRASPAPQAVVRPSPAPSALEHPSLSVTAMSTALGAQADSLDDDFEVHDPHPGRGRYKRVRGMNTPSRSKGGVPARKSEGGARGGVKGSAGRATDTPERFTPAREPLMPGQGHAVISQFGGHKSKSEIESWQTGGGGGGIGKQEAQGSGTGVAPASKPRARTHYQRELEEHKNRRIEWALKRRRKKVLIQAKQIRQRSRWLLKVARRVSELEPAYDSEEEGEGGLVGGLGGLLGNRHKTAESGPEMMVQPGFEADDWGEEAEMWLSIMKRTRRRLEVWGGDREISLYAARLARGSGPGPALYMARPEGAMQGGDEMELVPPGSAKSKAKMDEEIAEDLLAEHSDEDEDEEMGDDEREDGVGEERTEDEMDVDDGM